MNHENAPAAAVILREVLHRLGMSGITKENVEILLMSYADLDVVDRRKVRSALTLLGYGRAAETLQGAPEDHYRDADFSCPLLKCRIVSPCEVGQCRYHIDRVQDHNCLLVASGREEVDEARVAEIFGHTTAQVKEIRLRAMRKMRESTVHVAQKKSELRPEFTFLRNEKVCGVCESFIDDDPFYVEDGISFCSSSCLEERNPAEVILESRFGVPVQKLIRWVTQNFDTIDAAAQSLGYPPAVLTRVLG